MALTKGKQMQTEKIISLLKAVRDLSNLLPENQSKKNHVQNNKQFICIHAKDIIV